MRRQSQPLGVEADDVFLKSNQINLKETLTFHKNRSIVGVI